jgi:tRNA G37 N-methylase Trm5
MSLELDTQRKRSKSATQDTAREVGTLIDMAYDAMEGMQDLAEYHQRHGTPSLLILTQYNPQAAIEMARLLGSDIDGKHVVEIGAGVGFLAIEMAKRAASLIAIEVDPAWSWVFTHSLYKHKPTNLTWVFGDARAVSAWIQADVVVIFTRSGIEEMRAIGEQMAPRVILPLQQGDADG